MSVYRQTDMPGDTSLPMPRVSTPLNSLSMAPNYSSQGNNIPLGARPNYHQYSGMNDNIPQQVRALLTRPPQTPAPPAGQPNVQQMPDPATLAQSPAFNPPQTGGALPPRQMIQQPVQQPPQTPLQQRWQGFVSPQVRALATQPGGGGNSIMPVPRNPQYGV